jgi:hypothetical protein
MAPQNIVSNQGLQVVSVSAVSTIIAPSGTIAANGALTLGTSLPINPGSCYMYLPAGAAFAGSSAGFYFTIMSSATVGTVFNNIFVPATAAPTIPSLPTPIVATGPGAYTGVTTLVTLLTIVAPAIGPAGILRMTQAFLLANTAGNKGLAITLNGINLWTVAGNTNISGIQFMQMAYAKGQQISTALINGFLTGSINSFGSAASGGNVLALNPSAPITISYTGQLATATDFLSLEYSFIEAVTSQIIQSS